MRLRARVVDAAFWLGWNVLWLMPESIARRGFDAAARLTALMRGRGMRQLELNLSRVLDLPATDAKVRATAREGIRAYMRYYCETFLLPRWSSERIQAIVRTVNADGVEQAAREGGVILTLPHSGNWDLAGAWAATHFGSLCTVAERLRPEGVFRKFLRMRRSLGMTLMPLTGESGIYEYLRDCVSTGRVVALLGDRDVAGSGLGNRFFGHRASLPIGAALLALDTGRPLFTCSTHFEGGTLVVTFDDEVPVTDRTATGRDRLRAAAVVTAEVAARFERSIHAHPGNWYQLQPVWSDLVAL